MRKRGKNGPLFKTFVPLGISGVLYDFYDIILAAAPLRAPGLIKIRPSEEFFGLDGRRV